MRIALTGILFGAVMSALVFFIAKASNEQAVLNAKEDRLSGLKFEIKKCSALGGTPILIEHEGQQHLVGCRGAKL